MPKSIEAQTYTVRQVRDALKVTGELIAAARKERKWSQSELGRRLGGVDRRHISALEKGEPGVDFGLAVSALWTLNLPLLSTLSLAGQASPVTMNSVVDAVLRITSGTRSPGPASASRGGVTHGATGKRVIDNDF